MIAYFATRSGRVLAEGFTTENLDRPKVQMYVNRNNGWAARNGDVSKPYAVLTVEFDPRPEDSVVIFGKTFTGPEAKVLRSMTGETPDTGIVECQTEGCGQTHQADFSHISDHSGRRVFAVVCGDLVDYYTDDVVRFPAK
jgi:hypothetical protein